MSIKIEKILKITFAVLTLLVLTVLTSCCGAREVKTLDPYSIVQELVDILSHNCTIVNVYQQDSTIIITLSCKANMSGIERCRPAGNYVTCILDVPDRRLILEQLGSSTLIIISNSTELSTDVVEIRSIIPQYEIHFSGEVYKIDKMILVIDRQSEAYCTNVRVSEQFQVGNYKLLVLSPTEHLAEVKRLTCGFIYNVKMFEDVHQLLNVMRLVLVSALLAMCIILLVTLRRHLE